MMDIKVLHCTCGEKPEINAIGGTDGRVFMRISCKNGCFDVDVSDGDWSIEGLSKSWNRGVYEWRSNATY